MFNSPLLGATVSRLEITYSANQSDVDLFVDLGAPSQPVRVQVNIEAGVAITGLDATGLNPLSTLIINNDGAIIGAGGNGGNGGDGKEDPQGSFGPNASAGTAGSDALQLGCPTELYQTIGQLFGGGGGEGGEGAGRSGNDLFGGNGGGGGVSGGLGGSQGTGEAGVGGPVDGTPAGTGPAASPGGGGGDWGEAGGNGATYDGASPGAPGGSAGKAVELNGYSLTFRELDEASLRTANLIKGAIS